MKIFLILILLQILYFSISQDNDRLVFLTTHFRHGARAPQFIDETGKDTLQEFWTNPGELTGIGQRMHYLLGLRNRLRYIKNQQFLSESFDPHEILIYSSSYNRTMVSCSSQLQGFYPQLSQKGEVLTDEQINMAYPQVNIDNEEILEEINNLGNASLPYYMTLAPVRMFNNNEKRFKVYDITPCNAVKDAIKKQNRENITYIKNFTDDFNQKYGGYLNEFYGQNKEYDILDIEDFCDAFASCYTDQRELTELKKTGLNTTEMNDYCYEYYRVNYLYHIHGDKNKTLAHISSSRIFGEILYYMKRRVDADITEEDEDANYKDYSRPKMFMISGHDSTASSDEMFLIYALNLDPNSTYIFPRYASQLALEVRTQNNGQKKQGYGDYYVIGYFDDKQIFNETMDQFINKIEAQIWSDDRIDEICGFNSTSEEITVIQTEDKKDNAKKAYKILMIVFICLSAILLASTITLGVLLNKKGKANSIKNVNYNAKPTDTTDNNIKT